MSIPIDNVFYLFCYAWDQFHEGQKADVSGLESPRLQDLIAKVIIGVINRLIRRGLDRSYLEHGEDTPRLRGRLDFNETINRNLLHRRIVHCIVDDLSTDTRLNQIVKATANRPASATELDRSLRHQLRVICLELRGISDIRLTRSAFSQVQVHSHNAEYRFLMRLCELAYDALLPSKNGKGYRFTNVLEDNVTMHKVFESFVRNFYRREGHPFKLGPQKIEWDTGPLSSDTRSWLPKMYNDIRLDRHGQTLVIDTKYYAETLRLRHGNRRVQSGHLYQIFTYLKNLAPKLTSDIQLSGMLLYPTVSDELDLEFEVQGHPIRVCTINLDQPWQKIHSDLLSLVGCGVENNEHFGNVEKWQ